jgi:sigma-B regulation protein RsbU (phosphoserine phosphatase)
VLCAAARFNGPERDLVSTLTAENERLSAQVSADAAARVRQARELDTARDVQQRLLPQSCPAIEGVDYAGCSRAALAVGGDYYDFVPLPNHQLALALGDVCGKGVPAALLMATLRAYLHSELARPDANPGAIVTTLNRRLHESAPSNRFATFFYGHYDTAARELIYVNAGHHAPIVIRGRGDARRVIRLDASNLALGWMPAFVFATQQVTLESGDLLVAFSDGISEAMAANGDEWGESLLLDTIDTRGTQSASVLVDHVFAAIDAFTAGAPQHDDMTLVVMRVM